MLGPNFSLQVALDLDLVPENVLRLTAKTPERITLFALPRARHISVEISLISFDNSIETSIACYLKLHPIQRGNRQYARDRVEKALATYHTKITFLYEEADSRKSTCPHRQDEIIYIHGQRSIFYHENPDYIPSQDVLNKAREIAIWIFSFLFEMSDTRELLDERVKEIRKEEAFERDRQADEELDGEGTIELLGLPYKTSDVLCAIDPKRYTEYVKEYKERKANEVKDVAD